ncbi:MAG: F0F1 ATP synthase subunit B [Coriobacteriia bacterium]|nr:F0F1 ATP synthase subunit B [Coriobacteriia bacterium]
MKRYQRRIMQLLASLTGLIIVSVVVPVIAYAETAEEAHESSGGGLSLLLPNLGELIPMLVGFVILLFVLVKFGWPTIIGTMEKRVETIREDIEAAEASKQESAQLLEEQKALLNEARVQASTILNEARAAAEANRVAIEEQAARQAEIVLSRARDTIEQEKNQAMLELRNSLADLTVALAGRLIGHDLDENEHRRIIEYYVTQAGNIDVD